MAKILKDFKSRAVQLPQFELELCKSIATDFLLDSPQGLKNQLDEAAANYTIMVAAEQRTPKPSEDLEIYKHIEKHSAELQRTLQKLHSAHRFQLLIRGPFKQTNGEKNLEEAINLLNNSARWNIENFAPVLHVSKRKTWLKELCNDLDKVYSDRSHHRTKKKGIRKVDFIIVCLEHIGAPFMEGCSTQNERERIKQLMR
jgi:hypothetical protein